VPQVWEVHTLTQYSLSDISISGLELEPEGLFGIGLFDHVVVI
jgi:hypothetical protein